MKKIAIICNLDGFANSINPLACKKYFENKGHKVILIDTHYIRRFKNKNKTPSDTPAYKLHIFTLFFIEGISYLFQKFISEGKKNYRLLLSIMRIRALILKKYFKNKKIDVIICENIADSLFLLQKTSAVKIYNCATPYADELYYGNQLSKKDHLQLKKLEIKIYNEVDYLSFHWESYADYIKKYYNYHGKNIFKFNRGTYIKKHQAKYIYPPRIVYMGYLGGYWINLPLLSKLTKKYKNIDVYGYPAPDKKYELNYKGYANPDVLSKYQFGLITITKDCLRKEGFSAKHIEYLSYGLPVLSPDWRKNTYLKKGAISFNENNFLKLTTHYSNKKRWLKIHKQACAQAKKLSWSEVFKPLNSIIKSI